MNKETTKEGPEIEDETNLKQDRLDKEMEKIRASAKGRVGQVFKVVNALQGRKKVTCN